MNHLDTINTMLEEAQKIVGKVSFLTQEINKLDLMTQDLLHDIEMSPKLNAGQICNKYKRLKTHLENRRVLKDELEQLRIMKKTMQNVIGMLKTNLPQVKTFENFKTTRKYKLRVLKPEDTTIPKEALLVK